MGMGVGGWWFGLGVFWVSFGICTFCALAS